MRWPHVELIEIRPETTTRYATAWDELWARSTATLPTGTWDHLLLWQRHHAAGRPAYALWVLDQDQPVAALPLQAKRIKGVWPVYRNSFNCWSWAGELLVDWSARDLQATLDQLVLAMRRLSRPWLWFDNVPLNAPAWQQLLAALERGGHHISISPRFDIGTIAIHDSQAPTDFAAYQAGWSGNFRRQMRKMQRRAAEAGGVELQVLRPTADDDIAALLTRGFAVEDRSWKGAAGSSVLRQPDMYNYYVEQARILAAAGQLELAYLRHGDADIAFEYGWFSKGIYFTPKVGYDESYAHLTPGQLIRYLLLERFFVDPARRTFDFLGPLAEATGKWITDRYPVSRLLVSTGGWLGNTTLRAACDWLPRLRERFRKPAHAAPALTAASTTADDE